mmetsp:Transcript_1114/g.2845  ORF Transcript_1114/g.2845 Transcript_1114/m.2845 type:complete len:84 (-) Transcript_1114:859-1110(-)
MRYVTQDSTRRVCVTGSINEIRKALIAVLSLVVELVLPLLSIILRMSARSVARLLILHIPYKAYYCSNESGINVAFTDRWWSS